MFTNFSRYNFWKLRRIEHTWASTIICSIGIIRRRTCTFNLQRIAQLKEPLYYYVKSSCVKILYGRQIFAQSDWSIKPIQLACEKQLPNKILFGSDFKRWAQTTDFRRIFVGLNENNLGSISLFELVENIENGLRRAILTRNAPCLLLSYMWLGVVNVNNV